MAKLKYQQDMSGSSQSKSCNGCHGSGYEGISEENGNQEPVPCSDCTPQPEDEKELFSSIATAIAEHKSISRTEAKKELRVLLQLYFDRMYEFHKRAIHITRDEI